MEGEKEEGEDEEGEEDVWKQTWNFFKFLIQISNLNFNNTTEAREGMVTFSILAYLGVYNMFGVYTILKQKALSVLIQKTEIFIC